MKATIDERSAWHVRLVTRVPRERSRWRRRSHRWTIAAISAACASRPAPTRPSVCRRSRSQDRRDPGLPRVWVAGEQHDGEVHPVTLELLGAGRKLADKLGVELAVVLMGQGLAAVGEELVGYGADRCTWLGILLWFPSSTRFMPRCWPSSSRQRGRRSSLPGATATGRSYIPGCGGAANRAHGRLHRPRDRR